MPPRVSLPPSPPSVASAPRSATNRGLAWGLLASALVLGLALYARSLAFPWLEGSDGERHGLEGLGALFATGSPFLLRLLGLALHLAAGATFYRALAGLDGARATAGFAALVFVLHPLRVEAVAGLAGFETLLGTLFLLGSAACASAARPRVLAAALLLTAALALEPALFFAALAGVLMWRRSPWLVGALVLGSARLAWHVASAPEGTYASARELLSWPIGTLALLARWLVPHALAPTPALAEAASPARLALAWGLVALLALAALVARARAPRLAGGLAFFLVAALGLLLRPRAELGLETSGYATALGLDFALGAGLGALCQRGRGLTLACAGTLALAFGLRIHQQLHAWSSAERRLHATLALQPEAAFAREGLARWHLSRGRLSGAERLAREAEELAPERPEPPALLGEIALRRARIPGQEEHLVAARAALERSLGLRPTAHAAALLGEVFLRADSPAAAEPWLARAAELAPRDPEVALRLGMARRAMNSLTEARASFERAVALAPRSAEAWCGLGLTLLALESPTAEDCLRRALELEPELVEAASALAQRLTARGEADAAEALFRHAVGLHPDFEEALYGLGERLVASARADEGLRALEHLLARRPLDRPHVRASLLVARHLLARGEEARPRELLARVLAFNPAQAEARELLARLESTSTEPR